MRTFDEQVYLFFSCSWIFVSIFLIHAINKVYKLDSSYLRIFVSSLLSLPFIKKKYIAISLYSYLNYIELDSRKNKNRLRLSRLSRFLEEISQNVLSLISIKNSKQKVHNIEYTCPIFIKILERMPKNEKFPIAKYFNPTNLHNQLH